MQHHTTTKNKNIELFNAKKSKNTAGINKNANTQTANKLKLIIVLNLSSGQQRLNRIKKAPIVIVYDIRVGTYSMLFVIEQYT